MKRSLFLVAPIAFFSLHCTTVSSDSIRTQGIRVEAESESNDGSGTADLDITFRNGSNFVELGSSDQLRCEGRGMTRVTLLGVTSYLVSVPRRAVGDTYSCLFTRTGESYDIRITEGAPVGRIAADTAWGTSGRDFVVSVPNVAGTKIEASLNGSCFNRIALAPGASGGDFRFSQSALQFTDSTAPGASCTGTLEIVRIAEGSVPAGFEGGVSRSKQKLQQDVIVTR